MELTPEENDCLSFVVHKSRKADVLDMTRVAGEYIRISGTGFKKVELEDKVKNKFLPDVHLLELLPRTKAKFIVSTQRFFTDELAERLKDNGVDVKKEGANMTEITISGETFIVAQLNNVKTTKRQSISVKQENEEWSAADKNDWLLYMAESSRPATEPLVVHDVLKRYLQDSGIKRTIESIENTGFRRIIVPLMEDANLPLITKAIMLFATKTPATEQFLEKLREESLTCKSTINITKYLRRQYTVRGNDRPKITGVKSYSARMENSMIDFLVDEAPTAELKLKQFWGNFRNETKADDRKNHTQEAIEQHFANNMKKLIFELSGDEYDMNTRARLLLATSTPIEEDFLRKLRKHADENDIVLEVNINLTSRPTQISGEANNSANAPKTPINDENILQDENTWTEVEDNDLLGYIAFRAGNGTKLDMNVLFGDYRVFSNSKRSEEELKKRFNNYLKHKIEGSLYLHLARAKMLYATETPISEEFQETLKRFNIITVIDDERKILKIDVILSPHADYNDFMAYIVERSRRGVKIENMDEFYKDYKEKSGTRRSEGEIENHFVSFIQPNLVKAPYPARTIALMLYATQTPFKEVSRFENDKIFIETDGDGKITRIKHNNDQITDVDVVQIAAGVGDINIDVENEDEEDDDEESIKEEIKEESSSEDE